MEDLKAWCKDLNFNPIVFKQLVALGIKSKNDFDINSLRQVVNKLYLTRKEATRFMIAVHIILKKIKPGSTMIDYKYSGWNMVPYGGPLILCSDCKHEITDLLVAKYGIIAHRRQGEARFMDTRCDEQCRGITLMTATRSYVRNETIGLSVGGAKDVNNFRECIHKNIMPSIGSITYNGLLYEYYFDLKNKDKKKEEEKKNNNDDGSYLFYPSYCYAKINKLNLDTDAKDAGNDQYEYYMSVGLNSNIKQSDFKRKHLNLMILLDKSGSMSSGFKDNTGNTKMQCARSAVISILKHLTKNDRLGIVTFDNNAKTIQTLQSVEEINLDELKHNVLSIMANGGTNFEKGWKQSIKEYNELFKDDDCKLDSMKQEYENRLIILTDAQPNYGSTNPKSLLNLVDKCANNKENYIYTTFIGVGLDFNASLIEKISNTRGCNYYSVKSTKDFDDKMNEDFEFMVTPLVFNVCLTLKSEGDSCRIEKVYGCSDENERGIIKNGEITTIKTLFPSSKSKKKGGTKGGIQLIKLKKTENNENSNINVEIEVKFEDRYGKIYKNKQYVTFDSGDNDNDNDMIENDNNNYYDNIGIRKGILLCKYVELLSNWIKYEKKQNSTSKILRVNEKYKKMFNQFIPYFENEMKECNDTKLEKEVNILKKLNKLQF